MAILSALKRYRPYVPGLPSLDDQDLNPLTIDVYTDATGPAMDLEQMDDEPMPSRSESAMDQGAGKVPPPMAGGPVASEPEDEPEAPRNNSARAALDRYRSVKMPDAPKAPTSLAGKIGSGVLDVLAAKAGVDRHPIYSRQMGEATRLKNDAAKEVDLADKIEDIDYKGDVRKNNQALRRDASDARKDRQTQSKQAAADRNFRFSIDLAQMGGRPAKETDPLPQGAIRVQNPTDLTGKTFVDIVPSKGTVKVTDAQLAKDLGVKMGDEVPQSLYLKGIDFAHAREVAKIQAGSKPEPNKQAADILMDEAGKPGTHPPALVKEAQRQFSESHRPPQINMGADGMRDPAANRVNSIAGQFDSEPAVKNYSTIREAREFVKSLGEGKASTPTDDQGLLYAFAKAMDPNSVVREGEYNTVQKYSQSLLSNFGVKVERALSNKPFLTEEAKKYLKDTIEKKYAASEKNYRNAYDEYGRRIEKVGGVKNGKEYLTDYAKDSSPTTSAHASPGGVPAVGQMFNGAKVTKVTRIP